MAAILIIEDEPSILLGLENALLAEAHEILVARHGKMGLKHALQGQFDLIILDIMLPEMNGFEVLKQFRKQNIYTPVIILTAKGREQDKLKGFSRGADDYITKPFSIKELKARIRAVLKRSQLRIPAGDNIMIEGILFDFKAMRVQKDGVSVNYSIRELELLKYLVKRRGEVISRDEILKEVWGYDLTNAPTTRTIDNHIVRLRQKLEPDANQPKHIITIHGRGYRFQP